MTSGLASDSDKFEIIITLRRAQKFEETGPYKNLSKFTKWYGDVPGARSTRDGDTGNEDNSSFARFFKLDKYAMFSFAMTSGLASDSDKFEIIITRRRAQKFEETGPYKNLPKFTKWYGDVPGHGVPETVTPAMRTTAVLLGFLNLTMTPAMRTTAVLLGFLNLTNMPCSVLPLVKTPG